MDVWSLSGKELKVFASADAAQNGLTKTTRKVSHSCAGWKAQKNCRVVENE